MQDIYQFYPTPKTLAARAWSLFTNPNPRRVLEPSAGRGDLLRPIHDRHVKVDVLEINLEHHPTLREQQYTVVGTDFLKYRSPVGYSHIILNPPFNKGVEHVLHAWDLLKNGELVAIVNAETVDNPYTEKRQQLKRLIETYGEVKYEDCAFTDPDTLRKTCVRVALIHLTKEQRLDWPDCFGDMTKDRPLDLDAEGPLNELALPNSTIKNTVAAFNAAVESMIEAAKAEARANYYQSLISVKAGLDMDVFGRSESQSITYEGLQDIINERYDTLKEQAWRTVLRASDFTSRFTRNVRQRIEQELDTLISMEFTTENIHALLGGLIANKNDLDIQVIVDAFDKITQYHTGNRDYYRGWKSNDKHRLGWRIKPRRVVLPEMGCRFTHSLEWDAKETLFDIERAFALLDGKIAANNSIVEVIERHHSSYKSSERVSASYFDMRFYPKAGTVHIFPTRPDLVERMNRIVGRYRQWLPDQETAAPAEFWEQYENAGRVTKTMGQLMPDSLHLWEHDKHKDDAHAAACEKLGIPLWEGAVLGAKAHAAVDGQTPLMLMEDTA